MTLTFFLGNFQNSFSYWTRMDVNFIYWDRRYNFWLTLLHFLLHPGRPFNNFIKTTLSLYAAFVPGSIIVVSTTFTSLKIMYHKTSISVVLNDYLTYTPQSLSVLYSKIGPVDLPVSLVKDSTSSDIFLFCCRLCTPYNHLSVLKLKPVQLKF